MLLLLMPLAVESMEWLLCGWLGLFSSSTWRSDPLSSSSSNRWLQRLERTDCCWGLQPLRSPWDGALSAVERDAC
jgi:hypothetical protein